MSSNTLLDPAASASVQAQGGRFPRFRPVSQAEQAMLAVRRLLWQEGAPDTITAQVQDLLTDLEKCVSMGTPFWDAVQMHIEWRRASASMQKSGVPPR